MILKFLASIYKHYDKRAYFNQFQLGDLVIVVSPLFEGLMGTIISRHDQYHNGIKFYYAIKTNQGIFCFNHHELEDWAKLVT